MKRLLLLVLIITCLTGCKTSKSAQGISANQQEVWQTIIVKQLNSTITDDIIKVEYNNGTTLFYRILDNFGNIALTWDRTNGRKSYNEGNSKYKGEIDIPSFVTTGDNNEFLFRVREIDQNTFNGCTSITKIKIPYSVLRISIDAFKDCNNLQQITVNEYNPTYVSIDGILYSKDKKMLIQFPAKKKLTEYVLPDEVAFICPAAFKDNSYLSSIIMGDNVTALSDYSFMNCVNLRSVHLGNSVRIIGKESFKNCPKLAEIYTMNIFPPHNCPIVFDSAVKNTCKVYIPNGQKKNYMKRLEWSEFKNLIER
jgi:hypothetical protein